MLCDRNRMVASYLFSKARMPQDVIDIATRHDMQLLEHAHAVLYSPWNALQHSTRMLFEAGTLSSSDHFDLSGSVLPRHICYQVLSIHGATALCAGD
jgi:uncharacterized protein YciW